jgi:clan AA aspartic protease (TIGR02281 family)
MTGVNTLIVTINGVSGNFLLDTGATYVAVTSNFGLKAKLNMENAIQLPIKTVGGNIVADLSYAATVNVGTGQAHSVPVAVLRGSADPFGNRLDGLLGMSFLARFQLNLSPDTIELKTLPLR